MTTKIAKCATFNRVCERRRRQPDKHKTRVAHDVRETKAKNTTTKNGHVLQRIENTITSNERGSRWGRNLQCTTTVV